MKVAQSRPTLCDPMDHTVHGILQARVGTPSLLQGIFPTQGSNPDLPHCRQILYRLSHQGSLGIYPEKTLSPKDTGSPMVIQHYTQPNRCSGSNLSVRGQIKIKKMRYIRTMEYYLAIRKNEIMPPAATWMDPDSVIRSKVRKTNST